mgnify:CR=1 FL=1
MSTGRITLKKLFSLLLTIHTVEIKIGEDGKLYAPAYPTDATESVSGLIKMAANQADSIAEDTATLVTDFNALLAKLKAAGLMAADEE